MLRDPLFLVIAILESVYVGLSLASGAFPSVINILLTIFLWLIFAKGRNGTPPTSQMRCLSGTLFAEYVISWIAIGAIALIVLLVIILLAAGLSFAEAEIMSSLTDELTPMLGQFGLSSDMLSEFMTAFIIVLVIGLVIAIAVLVVITIFGIRPMHLFASSLYKSCENPDVIIVKRKATQNWLLVLGILSAVGAIGQGSLLAVLGNGSNAATLIVGSVLIRKYFGDIN